MKKKTTKESAFQITKLHIGVAIIVITSIIVVGYLLLKPVTLEDTDTIPVQTLVDTQDGVINQSEQIILPDKVETKTEYTVRVQYAIIDRKTDADSKDSLFTTKETATDNLAYVSGDILETTVSWFPQKTRVNVQLNMITSMTPITNKDGEALDITKQQLVPIITMEQVED